MSDTEGAAPATTPKKTKRASGKPKKPKTVASHPKVSVMVEAAITSLKERGGSSLQAIKKYIASHYKVDIDRLSPFIKKYLKTAVSSGSLVQTKGKGASGSFRLKSSAPKAEKPKKPVAKKAKTPTKKAPKPKKPAAKKAVKKPAAKKPKAVKKPKSPKPKKAKPAKKPAAKKAKGKK